MIKKFLKTIFPIFAIFCFSPSFVLSAALIVDHNAIADFDNIPPAYITLAKDMYRIGYGHTSHGEQIVSGMEMLNGSIDYSYYNDNWVCPPDTFMCDKLMRYDLGYDTWEPDTRLVLQNKNLGGDTVNYDRNVIMWSWCGQVSSSDEADIEDYLSKMDKLREDYQNVTFVYMTGHLDASDSTGNLHLRNEQIRAHVIETGGVLYDFADIERYDPEEVDYLDLGAGYETDGCQYNEGSSNWCVDWCDSNTCPASHYCAHSHYLNCYMKGKAFWWMMAKLAGWEYEPGDGDGDGDGTSISSGCGLLNKDSHINDSIIMLAFLLAAFVSIFRRNRS